MCCLAGAAMVNKFLLNIGYCFKSSASSCSSLAATAAHDRLCLYVHPSISMSVHSLETKWIFDVTPKSADSSENDI